MGLQRMTLIAALVAASSFSLPLRAVPQAPGYRLAEDRWDDRSTGRTACKWEADAVIITAAPGAAGNAVVECKTPLSGDFDAQISFELMDWNGSPDAIISMGMAIATPESVTEAARQLIRVGRLWEEAVDQYDARTFKAGQWRFRSSAIESETKGRLRILRRRGQVHASFQVNQGWQTLQLFDMAPKQEMRLQLAASNGMEGAVAYPPVRVRFSELKVENLPGLKGPAGGGGALAGGENNDWVIYANDLGWLRVGSRARYKAPEARSSEIWGGTQQDEKLLKTELKGGFATRDDALKYLCEHLTKVHIRFLATAPPYEVVRAVLDEKEYYLGLQGANDPEALRPQDNYDLGAEKAILRGYGITPRAGYRKLWIVHATGHGTVNGPVKDDRWMTIPRGPNPDPKNPGTAFFEIPDGLGGTFTYGCDKWEGPYRDNFGLARAMKRLAVAELEIYPPGGRYTQKVVAADMPEDPRDYGAEVLGVQPIVDSDDLSEWIVYAVGDSWLRIGSRAEFDNPYKQRETLLAGPGDAVMKRVAIPLGRRFSSYDDALAEVCRKLTDVRSMPQPLVNPPEVLAGTLLGKSYLLHLRRDPEVVIAGYSGYDLGGEMRQLAACGIPSRRPIRKQWLVHATGHGTYSGPVKDDMWMMVPGEPRNNGVELPDGMGGTFGYSIDRQDGPFTDNLSLAAALRQRRLPGIGLFGEDRYISADEGVVTQPNDQPVPARIVSISPDQGEAGQSFYVTVIATGMKPGYRFRFGPGISVTNETCLGKNPDGEGERWLATLTIDKNARFDAGK